jgi:hypothetical protein
LLGLRHGVVLVDVVAPIELHVEAVVLHHRHSGSEELARRLGPGDLALAEGNNLYNTKQLAPTLNKK